MRQRDQLGFQVAHASKGRTENAGHLEAQVVVAPVIALLGVLQPVVERQGKGVLARREVHGELVAKSAALTGFDGEGHVEQVAVGAIEILTEAVTDHHAQGEVGQAAITLDLHIENGGIAAGHEGGERALTREAGRGDADLAGAIAFLGFFEIFVDLVFAGTQQLVVTIYRQLGHVVRDDIAFVPVQPAGRRVPPRSTSGRRRG